MILINSSPKTALKIFQPFLPIYVPVGMGYLLGMAEKEGIPPRHVDEQVEDDVLGRVQEHLKGMEKPYIFGFSILTAAFKNAVELSKRLKELYPDSFIIFGGIHPTSMPEESLSLPQVDVVLRGEAELQLIELYRCIKERKDFTHIDNLSYRGADGKVVNNPFVKGRINLDEVPQFPYHLYSPKQYDLGFVVSSRGCPHNCIFCSNRITTGKRYRIRSSMPVVEELEMLSKNYDRRSILFFDDNLLVGKKRIYDMLAEIRRRGLDKKQIYNFQARGDNADRDLLTEMYATGFRSVFFGLETASEEIMKTIKKGETVAECSEAVRMAKEIGFHVSATFIYALPGETRQDRINCVDLSKELGLDMVRYNNATPYPGTELYTIAQEEGRLNVEGLYENFNSVSTFIENPFDPIPFSYVPEGSTEEDIRNDLLYSYFRFYLDFERLRGIFARPELGVGWFNAGEKIKDIIKKLPALFVLGFFLAVKFGQFFYYTTLKRGTSTSFRDFLGIFQALFRKKPRVKKAKT
jgi:anaerobic magnesium-protoporphyrin IX monomethyl ester cyclase